MASKALEPVGINTGISGYAETYQTKRTYKHTNGVPSKSPNAIQDHAHAHKGFEFLWIFPASAPIQNELEAYGA